MTILDILVQFLALARVLHLFVEEDGPYKILDRFRATIGVDKFGVAHTELGGLFNCYLCLGIWLSPIIVFLYYNPYAYWIVWCLAVAQGGSLVYALLNKLNGG